MSFFIKISRQIKNPTLNIMIGLPGVGKTTYSKKYLLEDNTVYLSSDDIRTELFGFENQADNEKVFQLLHKRCKDALKEGKNVIYDATNISKKRRMNFIKSIRNKLNVNINAYFVCMPISMILENNLTRTERFIPYDKLITFLRNMDVPMYYEGFDNIYIVNNGFTNDCYNAEWFYKKAMGYNQGNPYHNETLDEHTMTVVEEVEKYSYNLSALNLWIIKKAALYHDFGKLYTRNYNEIKKCYTYYNHEKVSAYLWYCYIAQVNLIDEKHRYRLSDNSYKIGVLIAHHMDFYKNDLTKTKELINDDSLFEMLIILNNADKVRKDI